MISSSLLSVTPVRPRAIHHQVKKVSLYRASRNAACFFLRCHLLPSTLFGFFLVLETLQCAFLKKQNIACNLYISESRSRDAMDSCLKKKKLWNRSILRKCIDFSITRSDLSILFYSYNVYVSLIARQMLHSQDKKISFRKV